MTTERWPDAVWRVRITNRCVGSGVCLGSAPHYFHQVAGYSQPRSSRVAPDDEVLAVAELCPMNAIEIDRGADSDDE